MIDEFERAVDAVVAGELAALSEMLRLNPKLARARSAREHRSTLLHYVSANGVEDFRQKTPANAVEVARLLLQAGADVNAESNAYGGGSTTLGLTATSVHPERAGVQLELMELLIAHGAVIEGPQGGAVNSCLRNRRRQGAEFLAKRGAQLSLEGAAGVGRLDMVRGLFPSASEQEVKDGFNWACEFGRKEVVEFLLSQGVGVGYGLHWAALSGEVEIVKMLLWRAAPLALRDEGYGATPLGWALYGRDNGEGVRPDRHEVTIGLLRDAGGQV